MANVGTAVRLSDVSDGSTADLDARKKAIFSGNIGTSFKQEVPPADGDSVRDGGSLPEVVVTATALPYEYKPVKNPLDKFASYTQLFTLAVLTKEQYNNPSIYRQDNLEYLGQTFQRDGKIYKAGVVFSSAGRYDDLRVSTYFGKPEYYVNNFTMNSVIIPREKNGSTNAIGIRFDVFEPYSMGLLLQSLQNAADKAGYKSYLDNCPYLMKIDFQGFTEDGLAASKFSKYFPMRLIGVKMEVNDAGSTYKIEAVPYNHTGFSNVVNKTFSDLQLQGSSVKELLSFGEFSLSAILNGNEKRNSAEKKNQTIPNEYLFVFPKDGHDPIGVSEGDGASDGGATTNFQFIPLTVGKDAASVSDFGNNAIGDSTMGFDASRGGNFVMPLEGDVYDQDSGKINRDKIVIDPKARSFQFAQGQSITDILTQIIMSSKWSIETFKNIADDGTIEWFKIDVQMKLLEFDPLTKDYAKKIIYRIVPYRVHHSVYMNPSSAPIGYKKLIKKIAKRYQYIYTGKNDAILKFDIKFDTLFYTGASGAKPTDTGAVRSQSVQSLAPGTETEFKTEDGGQTDQVAAANSPVAPVKNSPDSLDQSYPGGSGDSRSEQRIAEMFQQNLTTKGDMIRVNLDILGDPYWMVDSGIANFFAKKQTEAITEDGTMTYEGSEVYTILEFVTPRDINPETGLYEFYSMGSTRSEFGGIYKVNECVSKFNDGKFTQTLTLVRMPGQPDDYIDQETTPENQDKTKALPESPAGQTDPSAPPAETIIIA